MRLTADASDHQRKSESSCAHKRRRCASHAQPDGKTLLIRPREDGLSGKRRAVRTSPVHLRAFSNLQQQFQLACEERIVVGKIETEQRKRFNERTAPDNHFGTAAGSKVNRRELLEHTNRGVCAQNGNRPRETNALGPHCRCSQNRLGSEIEKLCPVMLPDTKYIESDSVRKSDFVEKKLQPISGAEILARERIRHRRHKAINSDFHRVPSALQNTFERWPDARDHEKPENGDEESQRQACWRHKNVKAKNIENNSPQNRKRQRNISIYKQQDRRPDLQKENHDIKPGHKQCPEELCRYARRRWHGNKMQKSVKPERQKNHTQQVARDGGSDLHILLLVARPSAEQLLFDVKCLDIATSCGRLYCIGWFLGRSTPITGANDEGLGIAIFQGSATPLSHR